MNLKVTIVLIAVGVAVGVVVWINPFSSAPAEEPDAPWFYQVTESDIDLIEVSHRRERVKFIRDEERRWQFEGLPGVSPRRERWGGMVLILTGPRSRRELQQQVDNPAQFGLDNPETVVRVKLADGRDITVKLGDLTTDGKNHYGQVSGYDQLFLITSTWGSVLSQLVTEPPLPKWFVQRNPDDILELSVIRSSHHGGDSSWVQYKIRKGEWTVQNHDHDLNWVGLQMDRWQVEGMPLLAGPLDQKVVRNHVDDFTPYGIFEKSTAIHLRFAGLTSRGTEYEDGVIYRIGEMSEDGAGYYARTEEGELDQPLLLLPADWVDAVLALHSAPLYGEEPRKREDNPVPEES